jgi:hypothetical protein
VLRECSIKDNSDWGAPTFIIPKKTEDVRVVTDFRDLNKKLKRKPYPILNIPDLLQSLNGLKYATAIDLNMGYYYLPLYPKSHEYCTIVLPWDKFRYLRLPMGIASSTDIFQNVMNNIFADMPKVRANIDDI